MLARWQEPVVPELRYTVLQLHLLLQLVAVLIGKYFNSLLPRHIHNHLRRHLRRLDGP